MADSFIFVNGTGVGMKPLEGMSVVPDKSFFRPELIVIDVPYSPLETKMRSMAKEVGRKTMNGLGMMLFQGAASVQALDRPGYADRAYERSIKHQI